MIKYCLAGLLLVAGAGSASDQAGAPALRPDQAAFRSLYKELVETNTTLSQGDCTLAAKRMAARLKAAGYAESELKIIIPEGQPRSGSLIASLGGTDATAKAILLLAHIDVV